MSLGELALHVGGEPDASQRTALLEESLRVKHDEIAWRGSARILVGGNPVYSESESKAKLNVSSSYYCCCCCVQARGVGATRVVAMVTVDKFGE